MSMIQVFLNNDLKSQLVIRQFYLSRQVKKAMTIFKYAYDADSSF